MGDRTGEAIELGDDEGVALAAEIDGGLELGAASHGGDLLTEQLRTANAATLTVVRRAFEEAGVEFLEPEGVEAPTAILMMEFANERYRVEHVDTRTVRIYCVRLQIKG
ncbi:hypothetical protein JCM16408A_44120 [Methylobacterium phyllosphaerae]